MKSLLLICLFTLLFSCTKPGIEIPKEHSFVSQIFKDKDSWNISSAKGFYHPKDSMLNIMVFGGSNERLDLGFKRDDKNMGEQKSYLAGLIEANCEHCASIKNGYRLDNSKNNSFEFMSFTTSTTPNTIGIRFSLNLKKDSIYKTDKPLNILYNGTLVVPIELEEE
ncbi:hypothetical protein [Sphingobacterium endophyticum]|uniref:hypothetical protein n=1 Tax=Sphingobacterium endophyticum TaxID=2546448 RepID=UPI0012E27887|nr:hypothetical protein [Sphingobacterium endophyticum]